MIALSSCIALTKTGTKPDLSNLGLPVLPSVSNISVSSSNDFNSSEDILGSSDVLSPISSGLSFASKDGSPDNLVSLIVDHREVYLLGENSSEVWVDVGSFPFPFQRIPGTSTQHGVAAAFSLARLGNSLPMSAETFVVKPKSCK